MVKLSDKRNAYKQKAGGNVRHRGGHDRGFCAAISIWGRFARGGRAAQLAVQRDAGGGFHF